MKVTKEEIKMNFRGHDIIIPKGTRITHNTARGKDEKYNFIDDLSFIDKKTNFVLWDDACHYGINIDKSMIEEI